MVRAVSPALQNVHIVLLCRRRLGSRQEARQQAGGSGGQPGAVGYGGETRNKCQKVCPLCALRGSRVVQMCEGRGTGRGQSGGLGRKGNHGVQGAVAGEWRTVGQATGVRVRSATNSGDVQDSGFR